MSASQYKKFVKFTGKLVYIGFGAIGQGVLPLLLRHIEISPAQISIISSDTRGDALAREYGIRSRVVVLTPHNLEKTLQDEGLSRGDFLLNLSVNVSSQALVQFCHKVGALYLDTCAEPWDGGYTNPEISIFERTNYGQRDKILQMRHGSLGWGEGHPTALICHGANPGLVSHFVKVALLQLGQDIEGKQPAPRPKTRTEWAALAHRLGVKVIHIAERDTQVSLHPKDHLEFVNTWSVDGFISEGSQPAELGWGTHEKELPRNGRRHERSDCDAAIYINQHSATVRVRSWLPREGPYLGFLITHNEAISIADYLTVRDGQTAVYRPTVHYAYHPCNDAVMSLHELAGKNWADPPKKRILVHEIASGGVDELGVLLMGHQKNAYWYGSTLSIDEARSLCPHNSATALQVTAGVLSGVIWVMENAARGIVEAEDMDFERVMEIASPYLGLLEGVYSEWNPRQNRQQLYQEPGDSTDVWQFVNFLVHH